MSSPELNLNEFFGVKCFYHDILLKILFYEHENTCLLTNYFT